MHRAQNPFQVNSLALLAASIAIQHERHVKKYVAEVRANRDRVYRWLESRGIPYVRSAANFILTRVGERAPEIDPFYEYDQFSARGDKQTILVLGGGFDYSESGANKILFHTVDAQFNTTSGWAFYGAYLGAYRNLYTNRGVSPGSYYDSGFLLQAAYLLTTRFEPFIRWDYTHLDGRAEPGIIQDNIDEISIGANYYLYGQTAKITIDGSWLPNGSPTDVNYLDILQNNSHNEFLLRAQFQLAI